MVNLSERSYQKELLDDATIPFAALLQNMQELNTINTYLGGHAVTLSGIKKILGQQNYSRPVIICEIGCGGGDNLHAIAKYYVKKKIAVSLIGIDIKPDCIKIAQQQYPVMNVQWIISDYRLADFGICKPDIIFSSLFCHHFTENELIEMICWMKENSTKGFFINDLERHPLAYYSIKWLTAAFSKSYLVKHDAPLSVARGFTKKEWRQIFQHAGISNYTIQWKWAFRHLITYNNPSCNNSISL